MLADGVVFIATAMPVFARREIADPQVADCRQ
jgi:hypothetical protein